MPKAPQPSTFKYDFRRSVKPTIAPLTAAISGAVAASSLQAATITVDTLSDGFPTGQCSLRAAVYSANTNSPIAGCQAGDAGEDIIEFDSGLSGAIFLDANESNSGDSTLPISEDVEIDGDGRVTIQGTGDAPVIQINDAPELVELKGLTITGGGGSRGGAIRSEAKNLTLRNCILNDNEAVDRGGAISFEYPGTGFGRLRLYQSTVTGNETTGTGGRGGAIYMGNDAAALRLYATEVSVNTSSGSGGAVDIRTQTGTIIARSLVGSSTNLEGNSAKYGAGGAINVVSTGGYGVAMYVRDAVVSNNIATGNGGGIAFDDAGTGQNGFGQLQLEGVSFQQNVTGGDGGAVWFSRGNGSGTTSEPLNEFLVTDHNGQPTEFIDNTAYNGAGALYASVGDAVPVTIENTYFTNNVASSGNAGGAALVAGNSGIGMALTEFVLNQAEDGGSGGGLTVTTNNGGDFQASAVNLIANQADSSAGGMRIDTDGGDVGLEFSFISGNVASQFGGGLQVYGTPSQLGIGYSVLTGNTAGENGGGLDLYVPSATNTQMEFKYSEVSSNQTDYSGGGISVSSGAGSQLFFKNATASDNQASIRGGAINAYNGITLAMKYSTVANNYAGTEGGGVFTSLNEDYCYAANSILAGNTAGPSAEGQDLSSASLYFCDVDHSLLMGEDSDFNNGTGNILYQDPLLQPLTDNGGHGAWTHALAPSSPAVDAGSAGTFAPDTDQRGSGFDRIIGPALDMGAYELQMIEDSIFQDRFETP